MKTLINIVATSSILFGSCEFSHAQQASFTVTVHVVPQVSTIVVDNTSIVESNVPELIETVDGEIVVK